MTEHTHDYMEKDNCLAWHFSDKTCCQDGTHQRDCGFIKGHHNERNSHEPKSYGWVEFTALALSMSAVVYAVIQGI